MARPHLTVALWAVAVAACSLLSGCGADANRGDCVGRVRYDGAIYEPRYDADVAASGRGDRLGRADLVDCGSLEAAPTVDSVELRAVRGVSSSVAVVVRSGEWRGLYILEDLERSAWPAALSRAVRTGE